MTNAMWVRQKAERLEIPDRPISTSAVQSVEAACHKFLQKRGMIYKLTSSYSGKRVKKEARDDNTKEAVERCAGSGTFPTRSDNDGHSASIIVR